MNPNSTFQHENFPKFDREAYDRLTKAIRCRDEKLVQDLIEGGAQIHGYPDTANFKPIHLAVMSRSSNIVKMLLDKGVGANVTGPNRESPLTLAAQIEDTPLLDILLSHEVRNHENRNNLSHFHIACMKNQVDIVKKLLLTDHAAVIGIIHIPVVTTSEYWPGYTALHFAAHFGCIQVVQLLIENGADITAKDAKGSTPLHLAHLHKNERVIDLILVAHKNVLKNPCNGQGLSHFHIACTKADSSIAQHFLRFNVDVEEEVSSGYYAGWRPIHFAIFNECPSVIELLLKCKVTLANRSFEELLRYAHLTRNKVIYELISSDETKFAQTNEDYQKIPALHLACIQNDTEKIRELCDRNVGAPLDLNEPIWTGCTPLHLALASESVDVVRFLLQNRADILAQNSRGKTSLHITFEKRYEGMCNGMATRITRKSKNVTDNSGLSIFHILCAIGATNLVKSFLTKKINVNAQVSSESARWAGFTPLHFAVRFQRSEVVDLLVRRKANVLITNELNMSPIDLLILRLEESDLDLNYDEHDTIRMLIKLISVAYGDLRNFNDERISPLHIMCIDSEMNLTSVQQYVIAHRDEVNKTIEMPLSHRLHKCTPLHLVMRSGDLAEAKLLIENGADPFAVNYSGETPFECGFQRGLDIFFPYALEDCYALFALVQGPPEYLKPKLFHIACGAGLVEVVKYVLDHVAQEKLMTSFLNHRNDAGQSPLHALLEQDNFDDSRKQIVEMLLGKGADPGARDHLLRTPLHFAERRRNIDIIHQLIKCGADVNAQDIYKDTPLHRFCSWYLDYERAAALSIDRQVDEWFKLFRDKVVILLQYGADLEIVDEKNEDCLTMIMNRLDPRGGAFMTECAIILLKHVKKFMMIGMSVCEKFETTYNNSQLLARRGGTFDETAFESECAQELEVMRSTHIDQYTTLRDFLLSNRNSETVHCENELLQEMVQSDDFPEKFPLFSHIVRSQIKKGKIRRPLLEKSREILKNMIKFPLTNVCLEIILKYLSNSDLNNIIMCGEDMAASKLN